MRFSYWLTVDRHGLRPRDDNTLCHCEKGASARDAAIHRVSKDAFGECGSLTEGQWIATGYALAMTRVMVSPSLFTLHPSLFTLHSSFPSRSLRQARARMSNSLRRSTSAQLVLAMNPRA